MKFYSLAYLSLVTAEKTYNLIKNDNTIRAFHDNNLCIKNLNNKKVRTINCPENGNEINSYLQWEFIENTHQIKAKDLNKCWFIHQKDHNSKRKWVYLEDCDENSEKQQFLYENGRLTHKSTGWCITAIPNKTVRALECDFSNFGDFESTCPANNQNEGTVSEEFFQTGNSEFTFDPNSFDGTTVNVAAPQDHIMVGNYNCQPTYNLNCSPNTGCTMSDFNHNCVSNIISEGFCKNKNSGNNPLKIAFWNVQILGDTKAGKEGVMRTFIKVFENFDIVGVSELRDSDQSGAETFYNDYLNVNGGWGKAYSERDGTYKVATNSETSTEQTIFYYRTDKVELVKHTTFKDFKDHFYVRGPHAGHFKRIDDNYGLEEFTMVQMHLSAGDEAIDQADYLIDVENVLTQGGSLVDTNSGDIVGPSINSDPQMGELYPNSIIFGGDFNAHEPYIDHPENLLMYQDTSYKWMISNDDDTNVSDSIKAYDRIIIHGDDMVDSACDSSKSIDDNVTNGYDHGILRFTNYWNEVLGEYLSENPGVSDTTLKNEGLDKESRVSDHWLVWFTIY